MSAKDYYFEREGNTWSDPVRAKFQATFSSGVATIDATTSDPGITLARDTTGDYDIAGLPRGQRIQPLCVQFDPASDTPATTGVKSVLVRSLNAATGTGKLLFARGDTAALADPGDNTRVYVSLEIETGRGR